MMQVMMTQAEVKDKAWNPGKEPTWNKNDDRLQWGDSPGRREIATRSEQELEIYVCLWLLPTL